MTRPTKKRPVFYYHAGGPTKVILPYDKALKWHAFVRTLDHNPTREDYNRFKNANGI